MLRKNEEVICDGGATVNGTDNGEDEERTGVVDDAVVEYTWQPEVGLTSAIETWTGQVFAVASE
ncbi:oxidoreductase [Sesbania bispinosa]|nr:oxidoreductase [Sesbania bispinosa]